MDKTNDLAYLERVSYIWIGKGIEGGSDLKAVVAGECTSKAVACDGEEVELH